MFAVPGWAVSASSLVQQQAKVKRSSTDRDGDILDRPSKKRKRTSEGTVTEVQNTKLTTAPTPDVSKTSPDTSVPLSNVRSSGNKSQGSNRRSKNDRLDKAREIDQQQRIKAEIRRSTKHETEQTNKKATHKSSQTDSGKRSGSVHKDGDGVSAVATASSPQPIITLTPLQAKMRHKLTSARFRHLNETLYKTSSSEALQLFTSSPELFADYHAGFAQQVKESWPQNPVDDYVKVVKTRGRLRDPAKGLIALPRRKTGSCTIADLGCGDAPLARGCQAAVKALKLKFHNYDLHASNSLVTKADISDLPLRDGEVDIAVFCLSLMGTNWIVFVEEAWRILRGDGRGEVWVAEVKSRFDRLTKGRVVENSVGKRRKKPKSSKATDNGDDEYDEPEQFIEDKAASNDADDETDVSAFVKVFTRRGFQLREGSVNKQNKMFVSMIFTKTGIPTAGKYKGLKWTGKEYQRQQQHDGKMRFAGGQRRNDDDDNEVTPEQEAKVLKPCVYKIR